MTPKSKINTSEIDPKTEAEKHPKIVQTWKPNGAQMELKRHQQINDFILRFSDPSGNIGGIARVAATATLFPADPPAPRHIIKDYCTIVSKDGWLTGSNMPRAVGPASF